MTLNPHHKHELRNVALGLGLLGIVAYLLFRRKTSYIVDTSSSPDNQPVSLPADAFGVPGDFSGLDGSGLPFQAYVPPHINYNPAADPAALSPDPNQTFNQVSTCCGC